MAVATANPTEGVAPLAVIFNSGGSTDDLGIESYFWDFSDGRTSANQNPNLSFNTPGEYIVSLTVTDAGGLSDTDTVTIIVSEPNSNQAPNAVASATPLSGNVPLEVTFTGSASTDDDAVVSYAWNFDDGATSTEADPVHTYTNVGTYSAELTVADAEGLTSTDSVTITVTEVGNTNQAPVAVVSATPETGEAPLEVTFTGSNSTDDDAVVSYAWDFGDGTSSTEADPTHTYTAPGTYTAELTVTDGEGLTNTASIDIEVTEPNEPNTNEPGSAKASIAPNPVPITDDFASVQISELPDGVVVTKIHLHDSTGRLVGTYDPAQLYDAEFDTYRIPIFTLRSGLYYTTIELSSGDPIGIKFLVSN